MRSVWGKLIQNEFGKERYYQYTQKIDKKESMDIFCDIYEKLCRRSKEDLNHSLRKLLTSVQMSLSISKNFLRITLAEIVAVMVLLLAGLQPLVLYPAILVLAAMYIFKLMEYMKNRFCEVDIKIVLIYKIALFHLLEENSLQKNNPHVY